MAEGAGGEPSGVMDTSTKPDAVATRVGEKRRRQSDHPASPTSG